MVRHLKLLVTLSFLTIAACSTSPKAMTEAEKGDAMKACFEKFDNYPVARDDCLNKVRTTPVSED